MGPSLVIDYLTLPSSLESHNKEIRTIQDHNQRQAPSKRDAESAENKEPQHQSGFNHPQQLCHYQRHRELPPVRRPSF
jgi:hypothetical protein